jgi:hypothetical protein
VGPRALVAQWARATQLEAAAPLRRCFPVDIDTIAADLITFSGVEHLLTVAGMVDIVQCRGDRAGRFAGTERSEIVPQLRPQGCWLSRPLLPRLCRNGATPEWCRHQYHRICSERFDSDYIVGTAGNAALWSWPVLLEKQARPPMFGWLAKPVPIMSELKLLSRAPAARERGNSEQWQDLRGRMPSAGEDMRRKSPQQLRFLPMFTPAVPVARFERSILASECDHEWGFEEVVNGSIR